jgi:hypothetical protein
LLFFEAERGLQAKTFGKHWVGATLHLPLFACIGISSGMVQEIGIRFENVFLPNMYYVFLL